MSPDPDNQVIDPPNPPGAEPEQAEKYLDWLADLISKDKLIVHHSDLTKFNVECMRDHYRVDLKSYDVEVSHSKHPKTGEDIFTMIFNNISNLAQNTSGRVILAYIKLTSNQFNKFRDVAENQQERQRRIEEDKRFKAVMAPVDEVLDQLSSEAGATAQAPEPIQSDSNQVPDQINSNVESLPNNFGTTDSTLTPNLVKPPMPEENTPEIQQSVDQSATPQSTPI